MLGFMYEKNIHIQELNKEASKKYVIEMKQTKTKLEISNPYSNIEINLNWESLSSSWIALDK